MIFFSEQNLNEYSVEKLYGLDDEFKKIRNFCRLVWSDNWNVKKTIYNFNPTIMLYGSPGTGKTTLLKNVASKFADDNFKYVNLSLELLLNKDLGKSSQNLNSFFEKINDDADSGEKIFIHFDDVDSVLCSRYVSTESSGVKRLVNTFIKEIDKIQASNYKFTPIICTTTNMYPLIDTAVKRRFSIKISIENSLSAKELKNWLKPIVTDLKINSAINYIELHKIMKKRKLTNFDLYLIMQNIFLDKLADKNVDFSTIKDSFLSAISSTLDFDEQKTKLSKIKNGI